MPHIFENIHMLLNVSLRESNKIKGLDKKIQKCKSRKMFFFSGIIFPEKIMVFVNLFYESNDDF